MTNTLLLSIRPEFAELIFAGTKTVELRRVGPRVQAQDWILVYVSTPIQALMGLVQVETVLESSPSSLWKRVRNDVGVTRKQFDQYYLGSTKAYGIVLSGVSLLAEPITLSYLRHR